VDSVNDDHLRTQGCRFHAAVRPDGLPKTVAQVPSGFPIRTSATTGRAARDPHDVPSPRRIDPAAGNCVEGEQPQRLPLVGSGSDCGSPILSLM